MTAQEIKARKIIAGLSTKALVEQFEMTETVNDEYVSIVRGWLMDELEDRNPEAFDKWIEAYTDSPRKFFIS